MAMLVVRGLQRLRRGPTRVSTCSVYLGGPPNHCRRRRGRRSRAILPCSSTQSLLEVVRLQYAVNHPILLRILRRHVQRPLKILHSNTDPLHRLHLTTASPQLCSHCTVPDKAPRLVLKLKQQGQDSADRQHRDADSSRPAYHEAAPALRHQACNPS